MSTSDTPDRGAAGGPAAVSRHQAGRAAVTYLAAAAFCMLFDEVYALFGHGVRSAAMSWMLLWPLLGGALPFGLRWLALRRSPDGKPLDRLAFNGYNSGIATLTVGRMLTGVFEIAGTTNPYLVHFRNIGAGLAALALLLQLARSKYAGFGGTS